MRGLTASIILQQSRLEHGSLLLLMLVPSVSTTLQPNCISPKCSRTHSRKDNQGISTRDSPLTLPPLMFTTICLTAIWKMNARAPKRKTQNPPKAKTPSFHRILGYRIQIRECLQPHPPNIRYNRHQIRAGLMMPTGWLQDP